MQVFVSGHSGGYIYHFFMYWGWPNIENISQYNPAQCNITSNYSLKNKSTLLNNTLQIEHYNTHEGILDYCIRFIQVYL